MVNQIIIAKPTGEVKSEFEKAVSESRTLLPSKIDEKGFYLFSKKNYGSFSMIEKPYYNIKGKFEEQGRKTKISYEIKGNSTFRVMSIVLPLMMLPTAILPAAGDKSNLLIGIAAYLLMSGIAVFWALSQERKLQKLGLSDFKNLIEKIK